MYHVLETTKLIPAFCEENLRTFFPKVVSFIRQCENIRQVTDGNTAHALCMLDNYGYRHTGKGKFSLNQAMKAERGSRVIALLLL